MSGGATITDTAIAEDATTESTTGGASRQAIAEMRDGERHIRYHTTLPEAVDIPDDQHDDLHILLDPDGNAISLYHFSIVEETEEWLLTVGVGLGVRGYAAGISSGYGHISPNGPSVGFTALNRSTNGRFILTYDRATTGLVRADSRTLYIRQRGTDGNWHVVQMDEIATPYEYVSTTNGHNFTFREGTAYNVIVRRAADTNDGGNIAAVLTTDRDVAFEDGASLVQLADVQDLLHIGEVVEVVYQQVAGLAAAEVAVDASAFTGNLSATDTDAQTALATIDALTLGGGTGTGDITGITTAGNSGLSGGVTTGTATLILDIHNLSPLTLNTIADDDRFALSNVSVGADETQWVAADTMRTYMQVGGVALSDTAPVSVNIALNDPGTATDASRRDHRHRVDQSNTGTLGVSRYATNAEALLGTSTSRTVNPANLAHVLANTAGGVVLSDAAPASVSIAAGSPGTATDVSRGDHHHQASPAGETQFGLTRYATDAEALAATSVTRTINPVSLAHVLANTPVITGTAEGDIAALSAGGVWADTLIPDTIARTSTLAPITLITGQAYAATGADSAAISVTLTTALADGYLLRFLLTDTNTTPDSNGYALMVSDDLRDLTAQAAVPLAASIDDSLPLRVGTIGVDTLEIDSAATFRVWYGDDSTIYISYSREGTFTLAIEAIPLGAAALSETQQVGIRAPASLTSLDFIQLDALGTNMNWGDQIPHGATFPAVPEGEIDHIRVGMSISNNYRTEIYLPGEGIRRMDSVDTDTIVPDDPVDETIMPAFYWTSRIAFNPNASPAHVVSRPYWSYVNGKRTAGVDGMMIYFSKDADDGVRGISFLPAISSAWQVEYIHLYYGEEPS